MMAESEAFRHRARTKIVATVGPACDDEARLKDLVAVGVDVFRLNMAHTEHDVGEQMLATIHRIGAEMEQPIAVLVDLAGPKIRLGEIVGGAVECGLGDRFDFVGGNSSTDPHELTSNYGPLLDELSMGDTLMLADGTVSMRVEEVEKDRAVCRVVQRGRIRSRQGINLPGVHLSVPTLGKRDIDDAIWAARAGADFVSLSFVRSAKDVRQLRQLLDEEGSSAHTVAKIEKEEALQQLEEIVAACDAVMVARGDLGVETDVAKMPIEQKRIITTCRRYQRPVIIATQMLDSMQHAPRPTRAETTDVANAILDGCDACMLSGETAIGKYPRESVEMMNRIALATEATIRDRPPQPTVEFPVKALHEVTRAVVLGAGTIAHQLRAKLVAVASHSGATALAVSSGRSFTPTIGVSDSDATLRRMCLYWGVTPLQGAPATEVDRLIRYVEQWGGRTGFVDAGDRIVIICGSNLTPGVHDLVMVHQAE